MTDCEPARVPHPAEIIRRELAVRMNRAEHEIKLMDDFITALYNVVVERKAIGMSMAADFSSVFGTTPGIWLALQAEYNAWKERHGGDCSPR